MSAPMPPHAPHPPGTPHEDNPAPASTRAVVLDGPGDFDSLRIREVPRRNPGPGEVRIAVRAIGVNFADALVRMGLYASARELEGWPIVPGFEVAGFIDAIGDDVVGLRPGDRVMAVTRFGAYTADLVVPAGQVFRVPTGWLLEQAAAFPTAHLTAWWALHRLAAAQPGEDILVHSAAGGVGQALCRLGRLAGCRVVGVVGSTAKLAAAHHAGAQHVLVRSRPRVWEDALRAAPDGYAIVFDANGADTLRESWHLLGAPGRLVVYGFHAMLRRGHGTPHWPRLLWDWLRTPRFNPLDMTRHNRSVLAFNLSFLFHRQHDLAHAMRALLELAEGRALPPPEVHPLDFDDVAEAHRALQGGQTTGKLVLRIHRAIA